MTTWIDSPTGPSRRSSGGGPNLTPDALREQDLEGLPALGVLAAWRVRVGSRLLEKELRGLAEIEPPEGAKERTWEKVAARSGAGRGRGAR